MGESEAEEIPPHLLSYNLLELLEGGLGRACSPMAESFFLQQLRRALHITRINFNFLLTVELVSDLLMVSIYNVSDMILFSDVYKTLQALPLYIVSLSTVLSFNYLTL